MEHKERTMFAVIRTGGKQYRVVADDVLKVDKVAGNPGDIVQFGEVLVVGGDNVMLGVPTVAGASVAAEVLDQARGGKVIAFKKRRRKNSRRKRGHRQEFTLVRITEILTDGQKPTKTARPKRERKPAVEETAATTAESAASEAAPGETKKPAAKAKPPAKAKAKPPAKKPAKAPAKKPAAKGKGKKK
jgi:large subunit ribosomal protein L21